MSDQDEGHRDARSAEDAADTDRGHGAVRWVVLAFIALAALIAWKATRTSGLATPAGTSPGAGATRLSFDDPADGDELPVTLVQRKGGFDVSRAIIPVREIRSGGPPKDGIPALTNPVVIPGVAATYLRPGDRVIGVQVGQESRAYPISILTHHEIVNDQIGDVPIAVTYCPLCDSAVVFNRTTPQGVREFGVSGLLFNSNVLMYDRRGRPESLWSQLAAGGVSGPSAGISLTALPLELTTWQDWLGRHPQTTVLSAKTGYDRDYRRNPYARYFSRPQLMFPVRPPSNALAAKTPVLGVWTKNAARAYPPAAFDGKLEIEDTLDGKKIKIAYMPTAKTLLVTHADEGVSWMYSFWFAWYAFRPQTDIYAGE